MRVRDSKSSSMFGRGREIQGRVLLASVWIVWTGSCVKGKAQYQPDDPARSTHSFEVARMKIDPVGETYSASLPVVINVDILNVGLSPLWVLREFSLDSAFPPEGTGSMWLAIEDESGRQLRRTCTGERGSASRNHEMVLPGQSFLGVIDLHPACYKFRKGVRYSIVAHFRDDDWKWLSAPIGTVHLTAELVSNRVSLAISPDG